MASMALAAMDSEPVEMPLDYLQGHKDGLEWAARLAEANHPETGDWLYDDPIELAKAIRKGPDMPPAQPVADSEPVIIVGDDGGDALSYRRLIQSFAPGTKLYRHAQQPVVDADDNFYSWFGREWQDNYQHNQYTTAAKQMLGVMAESAWKAGRRAAMLAAGPQSPGSEPATVPGKWIPVSERVPTKQDGSVFLTWNGQYIGKELFLMGSFQCLKPEIITHWMQLPAAPQEVKDAHH
ncbi:DUF551 domain-containing protein [Klebsiella pneumoniae]|nr:DUF551 domain-containing protein [Klebsiella pneumoniae]